MKCNSVFGFHSIENVPLKNFKSSVSFRKQYPAHTETRHFSSDRRPYSSLGSLRPVKLQPVTGSATPTDGEYIMSVCNHSNQLISRPMFVSSSWGSEKFGDS